MYTLSSFRRRLQSGDVEHTDTHTIFVELKEGAGAAAADAICPDV